MPDPSLQAIRSLYEVVESRVRILHIKSSLSSVGVGPPPRLPSLSSPVLGFNGQDLKVRPWPEVSLESLAFADDVVLLASLVHDLQHALERCAA